MQKEEGTGGRRVVFIKARRCGRTWVIWGMERDWAWLGCRGLEETAGDEKALLGLSKRNLTSHHL